MKYSVAICGFKAFEAVYIFPSCVVPASKIPIHLDLCAISVMPILKRPSGDIGEAGARTHLDHWDDYCGELKHPAYTIIIPSFDRPETLCKQTLSWLRFQRIDESRMVVLVAPGKAHTGTGGLQEWERYVEATRAGGFGNIRIRAGGIGLCAQMMSGMQLVGVGNYMVVMSDTVKSVKRHTLNMGTPKLAPIASGELINVLSHGHDMLLSNGFFAWSSVANHNAMRMDHVHVSRRLGLLDGNFMGMIVPTNFRRFASLPDQIYFVALTAHLWNDGHRICRYMMLSCDHTYRLAGGQASNYPTPGSRRNSENKAIRHLAEELPDLVKFAPSLKASVRTMQFKFTHHGLGPMSLKRRVKRGRPRCDCSKIASSTSRVQKMRSRQK